MNSGRWNRFMPRLLLLLTMLTGIGHLLAPEDPYWLTMSTHPYPYLMVVGWASIRYGWLEGVTAAILSSCLLLLHPWTGSRIDFSPNEVQIGSLIGCALFTGLLSDFNQKRLAQFRITISRQAAQLLQLTQENRAYKAANQTMRDQAAQIDLSLERMTQITVQLLALTEAKDIESAMAGLVAESLMASRCSYYRRGRHGLELVSHVGWDQIPSELRVVSDSRDLVSLAAERRQFQSIQSFPEELLDDPTVWSDGLPLRLMATPVNHPTTGAVLGVLSIERLPFARFTKGNAQLFSGIASLAGKALSQLEGEARNDEDLLEFDSDDFLTGGAFVRFLRQEMQGQQQGSRPPFVVLGLSLEDFGGLTAEQQSLVDRFVTVLLALTFRKSDVRGRLAGGRYSLLLYNTNLSGAARLHTELARQIRHAFPAFFPELGEQLRWIVALQEGSSIKTADSINQDLFSNSTDLDKVIGSDYPPFNIPAPLKGSWGASQDPTGKELQKQMLETSSLVTRSPSDLQLRIYKVSTALRLGGPENLRTAAEEWSLLPIISSDPEASAVSSR